MKKKTIWSLALALALVVSAIGASTAALAAAPDTAEPATAIATENEAAFIRSTNALTDAEKETLLADIKELNGLDAEMETLYEKLPDCDNMPLYEKALEKADPKVLDEIDTLEQEYDRVCEKHADLWDKVDEAYFDLPDDYDFENYEEAAFIRSLSFLTDSEKDALIADYSRLMEIDSRLCELYNSIWGNTGCESGICPL